MKYIYTIELTILSIKRPLNEKLIQVFMITSKIFIQISWIFLLIHENALERESAIKASVSRKIIDLNIIFVTFIDS